MKKALFPYQLFMTLSCKKQREYYLSVYKTIPPSLISYVNDIQEFDQLSKHNRTRAFKKLDALTFCLKQITDAANDYSTEYRKFNKYDTETMNSANSHILRAIHYLSKLKYNQENINLLKSIIVNKPMYMGDYLKELEEVMTNVLSSVGFSPNMIKRKIMPILRDSIRGKSI